MISCSCLIYLYTVFRTFINVAFNISNPWRHTSIQSSHQNILFSDYFVSYQYVYNGINFSAHFSIRGSINMQVAILNRSSIKKSASNRSINNGTIAVSYLPHCSLSILLSPNGVVTFENIYTSTYTKDYNYLSAGSNRISIKKSSLN